MALVIRTAREQLAQFQIIKNGFIFQNEKPLFDFSHALEGAENLVKRKNSKLRSQSRRTFINMLADSQHTCVWVSDLLFMNCHSISQDITRFSYIIMSTSCTCYYVLRIYIFTRPNRLCLTQHQKQIAVAVVVAILFLFVCFWLCKIQMAVNSINH